MSTPDAFNSSEWAPPASLPLGPSKPRTPKSDPGPVPGTFANPLRRERPRGNLRSGVARRQRMRLIAERGRTCHWCGEDISDDELTLEHLLPRREGGGNRIENLALAH